MLSLLKNSSNLIMATFSELKNYAISLCPFKLVQGLRRLSVYAYIKKEEENIYFQLKTLQSIKT